MYNPANDLDNHPNKEAEPLVAAQAPPIAVLFNALLELLRYVFGHPFADVVANLMGHGDLLDW
jgi:hypothetical protein